MPDGSSKSVDRPNRPLIVTSKTNPAVADAIAQAGWEVLLAGGSPLDAAEKATNVSESDPRDYTVGYGGDPNEEGFLQLDACVMSGPDNNNAGAVAALENIKTPCSVARKVMERTDHLLLVGKGALKFARLHGFEEADLLTDQARQHYLQWKEDPTWRPYYHALRAKDKPEGGGTISVLALDANGDIAGVTSTVGHHFKIVGRVGDSAAIGAGLYVDNAVGAAGCTGQGEESIKICASFLVVEKMREGMSPQEACTYACQRAVDRYQGNPMFNLKLIALNKVGAYGCCAVRGKLGEDGEIEGLGFCIRDASGHRVEAGTGLLPPLSPEQLRQLPMR